MDILLNPDIAYVLLVCGIMLGLMAMVTPGTGLFELGALFALLLAGYGAYHLHISSWAPIVLVLAVIPFVLAIKKPQQRALYLGGAILLVIIGSVFLFIKEDGWPAVNPIVASVVSLFSGGFLWFATDRTVNAMQQRPNHDLDNLIGQIGEAKTKVHDEGSVQAGGELWTARSEKSIPAGSQVRILRREGFVLIVEKVN